MSDWNEDVFLEKLTPLMRRNGRPHSGDCPDVDRLCAYSEDRVAGEELGTIASHVAGCARCRDLHNRLVSFATPAAQEDQSEWTNAEKRLNNWMEDVLRRQEHERSDAGSQTAEPEKRGPGNWWSAWKIQWAVGAIAVAALAISAVFFLKPSPKVMHEVQTAQATLPAAPAQSSSVPSTTPKSTPSEVVEGSGSKPAGEKPAEKVSRPKPAEKRLPGATTSAHAQLEASPQVVAQAEGPAPLQIPPPGDRSASAPGNSGFSATTESMAANKSKSDVASAKLSSPSSSGVISRQATSFGSSPTYSVRPVRPKLITPPPNLPASIRLEGGTRVWIRMSSVVRHTDGTLTFEGTLFEPVTQNGVVSLIKGTGVTGFEKQGPNSTVLAITGLSIGGTRYALMGNTVMKDTISRGGSGKSLEFGSGQLIELIVQSAAVYEKSSNATGPQAPR